MKQIVQGQVEAVGLTYEVMLEDGKAKAAVAIDVAALVEKGEAALPEGSLKPIEVAILEMAKAAFKAL